MRRNRTPSCVRHWCRAWSTSVLIRVVCIVVDTDSPGSGWFDFCCADFLICDFLSADSRRVFFFCMGAFVRHLYSLLIRLFCVVIDFYFMTGICAYWFRRFFDSVFFDLGLRFFLRFLILVFCVITIFHNVLHYLRTISFAKQYFRIMVRLFFHVVDLMGFRFNGMLRFL